MYLYEWKKNPEIWVAIHIKSDGTFNYQYSNSLSPYPKLAGKWILQSDSLIINSKESTEMMFGDTLKLNNVVYLVRNKCLKRRTRSNKIIKLKKISKAKKKILLNGMEF